MKNETKLEIDLTPKEKEMEKVLMMRLSASAYLSNVPLIWDKQLREKAWDAYYDMNARADKLKGEIDAKYNAKP